MADPRTLVDAWDAYRNDTEPADPVRARRAYMAGAQAVVLQLQAGVPLRTVEAEVQAYGRVIGTAAEAAAC